MITGVNTIFKYEGREFHLQAEDLGGESQAFEVRVYDKGSVVWLKRVSYADVDEQNLSKADYEHALRMKMEKTLLTVEAAITKGKIG